MSEYDDDAVGSSVFKSKECSSSIFYEDNEIIEELSKIISNDASPNMQEEDMKELKERNELKSAYKKQESMNNEALKEGFDESKIKATDIQLQSNLNNDNYMKVKSNEEKEKDDLYLKIEDFPENPISEIFLYEQAIDRIRPMISMIEEELKGALRRAYTRIEDDLVGITNGTCNTLHIFITIALGKYTILLYVTPKTLSLLL